jgi:hypothetical protein
MPELRLVEISHSGASVRAKETRAKDAEALPLIARE